MASRTRRMTFEQYWESVGGLFETIFNIGGQADGAHGLSIAQVSDMYKTSHDFLVGNKGIRDKEWKLYSNIRSFAKGHCERVLEGGRAKDGEELLRYYTRKYDEFRFSIKFVNNRVAYMNRFWVKNQKERPDDITRGKIYDIRTMQLVAWRDCVLEEGFPLYDVAWGLVTQDRDGERINTQNVKGLVDCFVELGLEEDDPDNPNGKLTIYKTHFQDAFITDSEDYYRVLADEFLAQNAIPEYMEHVEGMIAREMARVGEPTGYLHESTRVPLETMMNDVLIKVHAPKIMEELESKLLDRMEIEHLKRAYDLLRRIPEEEGYTPFLAMFEKHVAKVGRIACEKCLDGSKASPTDYIEAILGCHKTFTKIIAEGFSNDVNLTARRDRAFRDFINENAVTKASKLKSRESPRLLAKFCDEMLKKTDDETEARIEGCMLVFRYLHDNDVFQTFYQKDLARRLLSKFDDSAEQLLIGKLKQQCGVEWSRKLQKMYEDIALSDDLSKVYERVGSRPTAAPISAIKILTRAQWPFKLTHQIQLPAEMTASLKHFEAFYNNKHGSRKLAWLMEHSRGEISTVGFKKTHILTATAHQMAILSLFNRKGPLTIREVVDRLAATADESYIRGVLESLVHKFKLLKLPGKEEVSSCDAELALTLHRKWSIKKTKIDIVKPVKQAEREEITQANDEIEKARVYLVDAMIVKAMKALQGKRIKHQLLQAQVIQLIADGPPSTRFSVQPKQIKVEIAKLVEEEYMERPEDDPMSYVYIP